MRTIGIFVAVALLLFGFAIVPVAAAEGVSAFDPQSLVGEWQGQWKNGRVGTSGAVYITIKKVDGDDVVATTWAAGNQRYHNRDLDTKGKLTFDKDGTLTLQMEAGGYLTYTLHLVSSGKLEGEASTGSATAELQLVKK